MILEDRYVEATGRHAVNQLRQTARARHRPNLPVILMVGALLLGVIASTAAAVVP